MTMITRAGPMEKKTLAQVLHAYPEIQEIANPELRDKVARVWLLAWEQSKFDKIEDAVFTPEDAAHSLVDHIRLVVNLCKELVAMLEKIDGVHVNRDTLFAGALLIDTGKMIEFEPIPDGYQRSSLDEQFPHPFLSGKLAQEAGLPPDVVHIVLTHSPKAPSLPKSLEGKIVKYADIAAADVVRAALGLPLNLDSYWRR